MRPRVVVALVASLAGGCGSEKPPVTEQTFAESCQKLVQTSCERFTDCLAPMRTDSAKTRDDYIRECIADNERSEGTCRARWVRAECPEEEQEAYLRCERDVRGAQCSVLCSGKDFIFCWHPCLYFCQHPPSI